MEREIDAALTRLAERIGPGVRDLSFHLPAADGGSTGLTQAESVMADEADGGLTLTGRLGRLRFRWAFSPWQGGWWVTLDLAGEGPIGAAALTSLVLRYDPGEPVAGWRVPTIGRHVEDVGLLRVADLSPRAEDGTMLRGVFPSADRPGLFVGSRIPQRCHQVLRLRRFETPERGLELTAVTQLPEGLAASHQASAEPVWICVERTLTAALAAFAEHVPLRPAPAPPPVGWNSWDYYYSSVTAADVLENAAAIAAAPELAAAVDFAVVDMGWEHALGEWQPNHRFPGGLSALADAIRGRGFVPGIWTAPLLVDPLSAPGLRGPHMFVLDAHGDPLRSGGNFLVDPTHPAGAAFLRELFGRLFGAGYRFFKVDFVDGLLEAERFHDPAAGHYDALRRLFALIRDCVGPESHLLGCSLPPGCGPGVVDSGRVGVDIHNQWSHVEWAFDFLQLSGWLHERVWTNDADFLVVRGRQTSLEAETTVRNPTAHRPEPPRWRRGPVFATVAEARTWASIVALSGGSVFLGDRLTRLNDAGRALLPPVLQPTGVAARPLDLGDGPRASLWLQDLRHEQRLTVINWEDVPVSRRLALPVAHHGASPVVRDWWEGTEVAVDDGVCAVQLEPHASTVLHWPAPSAADDPGGGSRE